jgi:hypothetical protein
MSNPSDIKKALMASGLEVYRTRGSVVHVAERVRENLIMDARIHIDGARRAVGFLVRAQRNDFPKEPDDELFERARGVAKPAVDRGFAEIATQVTEVSDPGGESQPLDTWCEVLFEKSFSDLDAAIEDVLFVLSFEKAAVAKE